MKYLLLIIICALTFACTEAEKNNIKSNIPDARRADSRLAQQSKEEQLFNLLGDKTNDSIGGVVEKPENLVAIENLIKQGVDVNARDKSTFQTPLMLAAQNGRLTALRLLLNAKANPNLQDSTGRTALMIASNYDSVEMVKLLLAHGAYKEIEDNSGNTALSGGKYPDGGKGLEPQEKARYLEVRRLLKEK